MSQRLIITMAMLGLLAACAGAHAAGPAAGKAKADKMCGECHQPADWEGADEAELTAKIKDVVSGKFKHVKKIQLAEAEIADIAAYWAAAAKK